MEELRHTTQLTTLPRDTRMPINRCNLPAVIIGSLRFQQHPVALKLDGVEELHHQLFDELENLNDQNKRSIHFMDYMRSAFLLDHPDEAGSVAGNKRYQREKADYLRLLRGWFFNPDGIEAAVLKGWVESRFGLLPRNHEGPIRDYGEDAYRRYQHQRSLGLYNANALEAQIDLLYCYCQYELSHGYPLQQHLNLFRGTNRLLDYEMISSDNSQQPAVLLNNLTSFTASRECADEFGDNIIETSVPLAKLLYFPGLLSAIPQSEMEYLVLGGVYQITVYRY